MVEAVLASELVKVSDSARELELVSEMALALVLTAQAKPKATGQQETSRTRCKDHKRSTRPRSIASLGRFASTLP
jgi:hypothetical protein